MILFPLLVKSSSEEKTRIFLSTKSSSIRGRQILSGSLKYDSQNIKIKKQKKEKSDKAYFWIKIKNKF